MTKPMKIVITTCGIFCVLFFLLAAALPTIISSNKGKNFIFQMVNQSISGDIYAEKISVSWFGEQVIEGVSLKDPFGDTVATVELFSTSQPLWDILLNGWKTTHSRLVEFNANILQFEDGFTNLQLALDRQKLFSKTSQNSPYPPLLAKHVNGLISTSENGKNITSQLTGETQQGSMLGDFAIDVQLLLGKSGKLQEIEDLNLSLDIKNFPVEFIDRIASLKNPAWNGVISAALGRSLNAKIIEKQNGPNASTQWFIETPNLTVNLDGNLDSNGFTLSMPANVEMHVTSDLISTLVKNDLLKHSLRLKDTANLKIVLNSLTLPFNSQSGKDVGFDVEFDMSQVEIIGDTLSKNLILEGIKGQIQAPLDEDQATIHFVGKAGDRGEDSFEMTLDAKVDKPQNFDNFLEDIKRKAELNIEARGFPSFLFDFIVDSTISVKDLIGERLEFVLNANSNDGNGFFSLSVTSDNIRLEKASFSFNSQVELLNPIKLNYVLTQKVFEQLSAKTLTLRDPAHFQLVVDEFNYPLAENTTPLRINTKLIAMSEFQFDSPDNGAFTLENSSIQLQSSSLDAIQLGLTAGIITHQVSGSSWEVLGASTQVNLTADFALSQHHHLTMTTAEAHIEGSTLKLDINGQFNDGNFELLSPATISYLMSPAMLQSIFPSLTGVEHIEEDIPILLTIASEKQSMRFHGIQDLDLSGHLSVPMISLKFGDKKITLRDIMIPWEVDGDQKKIKLGLSGGSYLPANGKKGTFRGKVVVKGWKDGALFDTANIKLRLDLINFPTETFNLVNDEQTISTLMGHTIQAEMDTEFDTGSSEGECDILVEGDDFQLKGALTFAKDITLKSSVDPLRLSMKLTPQRFSAISKILRPTPKHPVELVSDSNFNVAISHLQIPIKKKEAVIPLWNAGIKGAFHLDKMIVFDKNQKRELPFNEINASIDTEDLSSSIIFNLSTTPDLSNTGNGKLSIQGTVADAFKYSGELNLEALSLDASLLTKDLGSDAFCQLFCPYPTMSDKVQALIGDPINTDMKIQIHKMNGPIIGTLQGSNGKASLNAYVKNGYLTLNEPFIAQVKATPELGQAVLLEIAPFLSGLKESDHPITLKIDPQDFVFPIKDFQRKDIAIGLCTLDMGKLLFRNSGQMQAVLGLLGSSAAEIIPIWVTPLYVRMKDGKIKLERVDMLLNNRFPIAAWGTVDIVKEKVNMTIGITGYALATALNIQGIGSDYMLQVPLKGSLGSPKLDKRKAAAKISALVAQEQGTEGMVIGTVLDIATGGLTESTPPSPTTQPLPWASDLSDKKDNPSKTPQKKLLDTSKDKVQEGAQKLFNKIFK